MNFSNLSNKVESIYKNRAQLLGLFDANLKSDAWKGLMSGTFKIPESVIAKELQKHTEEMKGIELSACSIDQEGIHISLSGQRYGARTAFSAVCRIEELEITSDKQSITLRMENAEVVGENILGWVAAVIVTAIINSIIRNSLTGAGLEKSITFDNINQPVIIDLSGYKQINALLQPVPKLNMSILDLFSINKITHNPGYLAVSGTRAV